MEKVLAYVVTRLFKDVYADWLCRKAGSGVDKILAGWRFANWRAPMLRTLSQPDLVELTMMMESMMDEGTKDRLVRIFGTEVFLWDMNAC